MFLEICICFDFKCVIFKYIPFSPIAFQWMAQNPTDDKSTLIQVMAWFYQTTSHYVNQCWLKFMTSYDITRPQRVKEYKNMHILCSQ